MEHNIIENLEKMRTNLNRRLCRFQVELDHVNEIAKDLILIKKTQSEHAVGLVERCILAAGVYELDRTPANFDVLKIRFQNVKLSVDRLENHSFEYNFIWDSLDNAHTTLIKCFCGTTATIIQYMASNIETPMSSEQMAN